MPDSLPLALSGDRHLYVFPCYGRLFQDMAPWIEEWSETLPTAHRFWLGFAGGGLLSVPATFRTCSFDRERNQIFGGRDCGTKRVYGTVLGNEAGKRLAESLTCVQPYFSSIPWWAVWLGLAERLPDPTVAATAEHVTGLGPDRFLLVVPRPSRFPLRLRNQLPKWFEPFGVACDPEPSPLPDPLLAKLPVWFDDPRRRMWAYRISGGEPDAAWQFAVLYYIAEYWDTRARGLDTLHFLAEIDGEPSFRRNWTSRR